MGLSAALCLNPVMVVGGLADPDSASWGLAGEVVLSLGAAVFLVAALCMADGVSRRGVEDRLTGALVLFYVPKVWMGSVCVCVCVLLYSGNFESETVE